jgi:hypothetical protein
VPLIDQPKARDPMRIYILWHPDSKTASSFAPVLYNWFRGDPRNLLETGFGIPVRYRCERQPAPIPIERAYLNIVVPLVDEYMVVSAAWRDYLDELGGLETSTSPAAGQAAETGRTSTVALYPVALHRSAYQLPPGVGRLNFLRVSRATDPPDWSADQRHAIVRQRLISLLTQACCRLLWARQRGSDDASGPGLPVKVFISHAKADGVEIAEAIRLQILRQGQMHAFFDESDLAIGYTFAQELERSASSTSTAMIAVNTDAYASRPWCQREIRLARQPKPVIADGKERRDCWRSTPLLVIDALKETPTRYLSEFGYSTVVRWSPDAVQAIIDRFLREILFYAYNEERAKSLSVKEGRHSLNCLADLYAALAIRDRVAQDKAATAVNTLIVPPPGYPRPDRDVLETLLSSIRLCSFDEVEDAFDA